MKNADIADRDVEVSNQNLESEDDVDVSNQDGESVDLDGENSNQDVESEDLLYVEVFDADSESEEDDADGDIKLSAPQEKVIYDRASLLDKLGNASWPKNVDWIHNLTLDYS